MSQLQAQKAVPAPGAPIRFEAAVVGLDRLAPDVVRLLMTPTASVGFSWRPGQYLSIVLPDGHRRSFSMAAACTDGRLIELHVRRRPGGRFSDLVLARLAVGDRLEIEGPFGPVDWRDGRGPAILIGTGTGIAPLKALLEHGLVRARRPIHLFWGGRAPDDLYLAAHLHSLARRHARLRFIPVLSRPHLGWAGRRGHVQDAVAEDFDALSGADVYACGSPAMIEAARARLATISGFDDDRFLADAFEPAPSTAGTADATLDLTVGLQGSERRIRASCGDTLLSALQAAGAPILSVCGGKASCGACKITVGGAWPDRLPPPERTERRLLANLDGVRPGDRLACQIRLTRHTDGLALSLPPETTAPWPA